MSIDLCLLFQHDCHAGQEGTRGLYEAAHAQILLNDDVVDRCHDESNLHGICCAGEMCVDLLCGMLVESTKISLAAASHISYAGGTHETNLLRM